MHLLHSPAALPAQWPLYLPKQGKAVPTAESAKEMLKVIGEASVENGAFVSMVARRPEFAP